MRAVFANDASNRTQRPIATLSKTPYAFEQLKKISTENHKKHTEDGNDKPSETVTKFFDNQSPQLIHEFHDALSPPRFWRTCYHLLGLRENLASCSGIVQ